MIYHKSILADLLTPVSAFMRVSRGTERAFLLESVEGGEKMGRYSFIGVDPDQSFEGTFADFCSNFPAERLSHPELPPFTGGAVGVFYYEMVREFERLPELKETGHTDSGVGSGPVLMDFYSNILAFDHLKHQIIILSHQGEKKVEELEEKLFGEKKDRHNSSRDFVTVPFFLPQLTQEDHLQLFPCRLSRRREKGEGIHCCRRYFSGGALPAF